jgi:hypothetical protein
MFLGEQQAPSVFLWDFVLAKQGLCHWSYTPSPFCSGYFGDGISGTIYLDWLWTSILPISASQVAKITGVRHSAWLRISF